MLVAENGSSGNKSYNRAMVSMIRNRYLLFYLKKIEVKNSTFAGSFS